MFVLSVLLKGDGGIAEGHAASMCTAVASVKNAPLTNTLRQNTVPYEVGVSSPQQHRL